MLKAPWSGWSVGLRRIASIAAAVVLIPLILPSVASAAPGDMSPDGVFTEVDPMDLGRFPNPPTEYRAYMVDLGRLATVLMGAPMEEIPRRGFNSTTFLYPPLPDGRFAMVSVEESPIMEPRLAGMYPNIKTYVFHGSPGREISGRFVAPPDGFQALIMSPDGMVRLHPVDAQNGRFWIVYLDKSRTDGANTVPHDGDEQAPTPTLLQPTVSVPRPDTTPYDYITTGPTLTVYRLAMATTGDYYQARDTGNGDADVLLSVVTEVNNLNAYLEPEVAIRMMLIGSTTSLFWDDPATDPYEGVCDGSNMCDGGADDDQPCNSNADCRPSACQLRDENPAAVNGVINLADYDIAYVFGNGGGNGCAWYVVCQNDKARGAGLVKTSNAVGSATRLMAHEMGHQLDARHTFSGQDGGCSQTEFNPGNGYEPGSGTTTMSYLNICKTDNVDTSKVGAGFYYSTHSFEQIADNTANGTGSTCGTKYATGNAVPNVSAGANYTIPRSTPFTLTGSGNDPDGDPLTFAWEQYDGVDSRRAIDTDPGADGPIIRSVPPGPMPVRTVPNWACILSNTQLKGEILPFQDRDLTFRLTARDNRMGGGGVSYDTMTVSVEGDPFFVISPNGGETFGTDCTIPVTWEKGGSNTANVNVRLSTDSGLSFPTTLASGTPNDGSTNVTLTCDATTGARVMVAGDGNIFFDVSNGDFRIQQVTPTSQLTTNGGSVDDQCEFKIPIASQSTDDCRLAAADVTAGATLLTGNATLGPTVFTPQQLNTTTVDGNGSVLVSDLTSCPATVRVAVTATDGCGDAGNETKNVDVVDDTPPVLMNTPPDMTVECDAVPAPAAVTAQDNCDPDPQLDFNEMNIPGNCPGNYTLKRTWTATDECGVQTSYLQTIMVQDTTPPDVTTSDDDLYCVWPPNHRMVCFGQQDFDPQITDNCSEPITWVFAGCAPDQPADGPDSGWNGDGSTEPDCSVAPDGLSFCVRAERAGSGPDPDAAQLGRRYAVGIVATDACGNASAPMVIGNVFVPHDQSPAVSGCIRPTGKP